MNLATMIKRVTFDETGMLHREGLSYFDHYQSTVIRSMNILLDIGQTILIGGIKKIDVKHVRA